MSSRLSGRYLTVNVRYEPDLKEGPQGELLQVVDYDPVRKKWYAQVNLNDTYILAQDGLRPREADPRSHQQIAYAVASSVIERFQRYLGRRFRWRGEDKLRLVPHAFQGRNAFFDPKRKAVLFGYYRAEDDDPGANLPGQIIFTCLSSDIIAHEVTHAIVHRLRPYFAEASNKDVFAWHEAFADLIALFQHFAYPEVVLDAVSSTSGSIQKGGALFDLASEFGQSTGRGEALRRAINPAVPTELLRTPDQFKASTEAHERGACFVGAVFDAYLDRYRSAISDLLRIAASGPGGLTEPLHPDLVHRVTREAIITADRYLGMVVRAFDYLPPVDVTFGDVIQAIVTSDYALYPEDELGLRRNLIESLRRRGIYPDRVISLTDTALVWPAPGRELSLKDGKPAVPLDELVLDASSRLDPTLEPTSRDPSVPTADEGLRKEDLSSDLYRSLTIWAREHAVAIGFEPSEKIALDSVDVAYRQADDLQPRPEIVVQFTQRRRDLEATYQPDLPRKSRTPLRAGTTLIARLDGIIQHIISKPLPLKSPRGEEARYVHAFGKTRFEAMVKWFDEVDEGDPLSMWIDEPAVHRVNFASLHYETQVGV